MNPSAVGGGRAARAWVTRIPAAAEATDVSLGPAAIPVETPSALDLAYRLASGKTCLDLGATGSTVRRAATYGGKGPRI